MSSDDIALTNSNGGPVLHASDRHDDEQTPTVAFKDGKNGYGPEEKNGFHKPTSADNVSITLNDKEDDMKNGDSITGEKKTDPVERVSLLELFRFADCGDRILMTVGSICMFCIGAALPANLFFFGQLLTDFVQHDMQNKIVDSNVTMNDTAQLLSSPCFSAGNGTGMATGKSAEELLHLLQTTYIPAFCSIGFGAFLLNYIGMSFWTWTSERQIRRIRLSFFHSIMKQSIGWFDTNDVASLNTRLVEDVERLHDGFGDKIATFIMWTATFIGGFAIGFVNGWKLALVVIAASPILVLVGAVFSRFVRRLVQKELKAYSRAGAVAEETFSVIRTVVAFGGEDKAEAKYSHSLSDATKEGVRKASMSGLMLGMFWLIIFSVFALAFWYGGKLVREECLSPGVILQVIFGVLIGALSLGNAVPLLENFANARGSAATIFKTIDAKSEIDSTSDQGITPKTLDGNVEFRDVHFSYPARKEVKILNGLNLSVRKGQTIALVGESGCGKSTTIQLLQRFYECSSGQVLVDGRNIQDYSLTWLRDQMGIVSQEPVLFATTIMNNLKLGAKASDVEKDVTQEQIENACKIANCYDFIAKLPQGFETLVGERGVQLSGGQKQRIAIARALIRNPTILLLDEATSALDTQSEGMVQDALNKASEGRTTIVIAHRLSTVRNADMICAFRDGVVHEHGTHRELMEKQGIYYSLCMQQMKKEEDEKGALQQEMSHHSTATSPTTSENKNLGRNVEVGITEATELSLPSPTSPSTDHPLLMSQRSSSFRRSTRSRASTRSYLGVDTPPVVDSLLAGNIDSLEDDAFEENTPEKKVPQISYWEILRMNAPEWPLILIGSIASIGVGAIQPCFALVMSELIGVFAEPDLNEQKRQISLYCGLVVCVGAGAALATLIQQFTLATSGEKLTERLRKSSFATMIKQEIGYFDRDENGVGQLVARLASDASLVKGATGMRIGTFIQTVSILVTCLLIAFLSVWQLSLVMMLFIPLAVGAGAMQSSLMRGYAKGDQAGIEQGGKIAQEAISNIRTVTSLNRQRFFIDNYIDHFNKLYVKDKKKSFVSSITFAFSNSLVYFMYAVCFGYGGWLVLNVTEPRRYEFFSIFRVFACVNFGGMAIGRASVHIPDYAKAKQAAYNIRQLLSRKSLIDHGSPEGVKVDKCDGTVSFHDVTFSYPTRKTTQVLNGLTVEVNKGETLALVGSSGCGKSTSIALLERFYDPSSGKVVVSGTETKAFNVSSLRKHLGIVSQEPTLFDETIAENIAYGDNTRTVDMMEIIEAAKQANINDFISNLPQGYETRVGAKGTQLSGGQKQRIAIARALIRNPAILLLDEATSALDFESEKVVQEALEKAQKGRTSVIIAHRLSTIKKADKIAVIENGKVVEIGTHSKLISMKGAYYNLVNAQL